MSDNTHKASILKAIMNTGAKTAADFHISNANQYLNALEKEGILYHYWMQNGKKRFKLRDIFNHTKANAFLAAYRKVNEAKKTPDNP